MSLDEMLDEAIIKAKANGDWQLADWLRTARGSNKAGRYFTQKILYLKSEIERLKRVIRRLESGTEVKELTRLANIDAKMFFEMGTCHLIECGECEVKELCDECVYLEGKYGIDKDLA